MTDTEHPIPGTEGPRGHEARAPVDDRKVPWRVFLVIGGGVFTLAVIYWLSSYEDAGTVLLALTAVLAAWVGVYLWLQQRREGPDRVEAEQAAGEVAAAAGTATTGTGIDTDHEHYLPHASVWPFAIGLGAATLANGLVLGLWVIVPGAALMGLGLGGFVRQTRRRD